MRLRAADPQRDAIVEIEAADLQANSGFCVTEGEFRTGDREGNEKKGLDLHFIQLMCFEEEERPLEVNQSRNTIKDFSSWSGFYHPTLIRSFKPKLIIRKAAFSGGSAGAAGGGRQRRRP